MSSLRSKRVVRSLVSLLFLLCAGILRSAHAQSYESFVVANSSRSVTVSLPDVSFKPAQMGVVINANDPQSVDVGTYYAAKHGIPPENVVRVSLPVKTDVTRKQLAPVYQQVMDALPPTIEALALTWNQPFRVDGLYSITSAFMLGCDLSHCGDPNSGLVEYQWLFFKSRSIHPRAAYGILPTMVVTGYTTEDAIKLIDHGFDSSQTLGGGTAYVLRSTDALRSTLVFGQNFETGVDYWNKAGLPSVYTVANSLVGKSDILFYTIGRAAVQDISTNQFLPGAVAWHPTSFGGQLLHSSQMSILEWIKAGATGSYGTVSEPHAFPGKFPNLDTLFGNYFTGRTLIQSLLPSVAASHQGLFVGDPLARPFGTPVLSLTDDGVLNIETTRLEPERSYELRASDSPEGPFSVVQTLTPSTYAKTALSVPEATHSYYTLVDTTDKNLPSGAILAPAEGAVIKSNFIIKIKEGEDPSPRTVVVSVDGKPNLLHSALLSQYPVDVSQLADGDHLITAQFSDASENVTERTVHFTLARHLDLVPPRATFTTSNSVIDLRDTNAYGTFTVAASDDTGVVNEISFLIDGKLDPSSTVSWLGLGARLGTISFKWHWGSVRRLAVDPRKACLFPECVESGVHHFQARVKDAAGNTSLSDPLDVTVIRDTVPPEIKILSPKEDAAFDGLLVFHATATDNEDRLNWGVLTMDRDYPSGSPIGSCTDPADCSLTVDLTNYKEGVHTYYYHVWDTSGNVATETGTFFKGLRPRTIKRIPFSKPKKEKIPF